MKVIIAYTSVVFIWATTPLAVQWSNSSLSFQAAVTARMALAALLCAALLLITRRPLVKQKKDVLAFAAGAVGIFPNMLLVYWSAQFIPSSLIAVIFGTYPFFTGLFALLLLKQNAFNLQRVLALLVAVAGLVLINLDQLALGKHALWGVLGILCSSALFAFSTVLVKKSGAQVDAFRQLSGSLFIAAPFFVLTWLLTDANVPQSLDIKSIVGVTYLVLAGSMFGGVAFYYVLTRCQVVTVSLIPLLTPVMAIALGVSLEGEQLSAQVFFGSALVLFSLALFQGLVQSFGRFIYRFSYKGLRKGVRMGVLKIKPLFI
ncbi:DMT family transporter [Agaribacterium haliotis]|uniref:DMT family transporter n=1 Tax=Agaribacterium haliotis TaxID=2013869 RepID=UPI000BB54655|nr:DMT family transporter [Agaribacterium haliotis]